MNKLFDCCKNKKKRSVVLNWTTRTPWFRCLRMRLVFCLENRVQLELIYSQFNAWHQEIVWKRRRQRFDVIIGAGFFSLEAVWISPWKAAKPLHILQCLSDWFYLHLMRHTLRCKWASSSCLFFLFQWTLKLYKLTSHHNWPEAVRLTYIAAHRLDLTWRE